MGQKYSKQPEQPAAKRKTKKNAEDPAVVITKKSIDKVRLMTQGMDLLNIRARMLQVSQGNKLAKSSSIYFLTTADVKKVFPTMTDGQIYHLFGIYDISKKRTNIDTEESTAGVLFQDNRSIHEMKISSLDFWGSLALLATDSVDEKVNYCFRLMVEEEVSNGIVVEENPFLHFNDLVVLVICITRAISKIKGLLIIPTEELDKMIVGAFRAANDNIARSINKQRAAAEDQAYREGLKGGIGLKDFRTFLKGDDKCREYLAAIGSKLEAVDAAAIVMKRADLQRLEANIRAEMAKIMCEIDEINGEQERMENERGGDAGLLKLTAAETAAGSQAMLVKPPRAPSKATMSNHFLSTESRMPIGMGASLLGGKGKKKKGFVAEIDAEVFSDTRGGKPPAMAARNIYGINFKQDFLKAWSTQMNAQLQMKSSGGPKSRLSEDGMLANCDVFTIVDIFDSVGITVPLEDALDCLYYHAKSTTADQISFEAVLRWYRMYAKSDKQRLEDEREKASSAGDWSRFWQMFQNEVKRRVDSLKKLKSTLQTQRGVLEYINDQNPEGMKKYHSLFWQAVRFKGSQSGEPASPSKSSKR